MAIILNFKTVQQKETVYKMLQDLMVIEARPFEVIEHHDKFIVKPPTDLIPVIIQSYKTIINHLGGSEDD